MNKIYPIVENQLKKHGVTEFELFFERQEGRTFQSKELSLDSAEEKVRLGLSLRVFQDHRFSHAYTSDLSEVGLSRAVESAVQILPLVDPDPDLGLPPNPGSLPKEDLKNFDPGLNRTPAQAKIDLALNLEKVAISTDPRIKHVRSAHYSEVIVEQTLRNSQGFHQSHQSTECSLGLLAVAEDRGEAESGFEFAQNCFFDTLDPEAVGRAAAQKALDYLGGQTPPSGKYPVVLDPLVAGEFLDVLCQSFQGDEIFKKRSRLAGKIGEKIYSEQLNLVDNSLLPGGMASSHFDGEGQAGRQIPLVEKGEIKNFLLDFYFGRKLKMNGNASSRRSGTQKPPKVGPSNLYIPAGSLTDEEIFRELGEGIWITEVIGMHAADPISGDFSVGAQGFFISQGGRGQALKKMALAGNLHQIFKILKWVGKHHRFYDNIGAPTLGFPEMSVSGN